MLFIPRAAPRRDLDNAFFAHLIEHAGRELSGRVCSQGPRGVDVADDESAVGEVFDHDAFPGEVVRDMERLGVDCDFHAACESEFEARGCHDDVGGEFFAAVEFDGVGRHGGDGARFYG